MKNTKEKIHRSKTIDWDKALQRILFVYALFLIGNVGYMIYSNAYHSGYMNAFHEYINKNDYERGMESGYDLCKDNYKKGLNDMKKMCEFNKN